MSSANQVGKISAKQDKASIQRESISALWLRKNQY